MSLVITATETQNHPVLHLSDRSLQVRQLLQALRTIEIFGEHGELLEKLEAQLGSDLPLTLAHLYFRVLSSEAGAPFRARVIQWLAESIDESVETFLSTYPQRWACQILGALRQLGKNPLLITHFEEKLQHAPLGTYAEQEDFALNICCLLFEMDAMQGEFAALLAMTVPPGESALQFAQTYHRGRHEHHLVLQAQALEKRVEEASTRAFVALEQAALLILPKLEDLGQLKKTQDQRVASLGQQVLEQQTDLDQLANELLDL